MNTKSTTSILLYTTLPKVGGNSTIAATLALFFKDEGLRVVMVVKQIPNYGYNEELAEFLAQKGIILRIIGGSQGLRSKLAALEAVIIARSLQCDTLISIGMRRVASFLARWGGFKRTIYYYIVHEPQLSLVRQLGHDMYCFDKIVAISPSSLPLLQELIKPHQSIEWIPQFSELPQAPASKIKEITHSPRFGFIGHLIEGKGINLLLNLWSSNPNLNTLAVLGDGPLRTNLIAAAKNDNRILYQGGFSAQERNQVLPEFFSTIDFLLVPSTAFEGLPTVILEALSCGCPVITTPNGGTDAFETGMLGDVFGKYVQVITEKKWLEFPASVSLVVPSKDAIQDAYDKVFSGNALSIKWLQLVS